MIDHSVVAPLFRTDAYKLDHRRQYPPGTTRVYSNYTNRRSRLPGVDHVVHFGLQAFIQKYLMQAWEPFFAAPINEVCLRYHQKFARVLGRDAANAAGTDHIAALHRLGYLPLRFCGLPEGTLVPIGVPAWTVENTHDDFAWLTNFVETPGSAGYWSASTCATIAHEYRKILLAAAARTGADPASVDWQCHGFEYRGMFGNEAPEISGAAHLLSFNGTDSVPALDYIDAYYGGYPGGFDEDENGDPPNPPISIPATEHSVMSAGIAYGQKKHGLSRVDAETEVFNRLLDLYPTGNLAIVSDTFNLWDVLTVILPRLKDKILSRDGKLVIRPDSGDPEKILCGDPEDSGPPREGVVRLLSDVFGSRVNRAGLHELDAHVGALYGDSINLDRIRDIPASLEHNSWASSPAGYGVGSFTYHYFISRDTFSSAMKATAACIDGEWYDLFKDPITDDGTKKSATGRLAVLSGPYGELSLVQRATPDQEAQSLLQPIWENGQFLRYENFADIKQRLNS